MSFDLDKWLEVTNSDLSKEDIPHIRRPFEAMRRLNLERRVSFMLSSPLAKHIIRWFEEHSPTGSHGIGAMFTSLFYFDSYFWKVDVPLAYGTVQLNALDALREMPEVIRDQLQRSTPTLWVFIALWVDSLDYAFGFEEVGRGSRLPAIGNVAFAEQLITSAHRELTATVRLLTEERRPNPKAMETGRMATEMFLKAYLALHGSLSELHAQRKLSHDLEKALAECESARPHADLSDLRQFLGLYPQIGARYQALSFDSHQLWSSYATALRSGVTVIRSITNRDSRSQIRPVPNTEAYPPAMS